MNATIYLKSLKTTIVLSFILFVILFFVDVVSAADNNPVSLRLTNKISGSGRGSSYNPEIVFNRNRVSISLGAHIQKRKTNFSGINSEFQFNTGSIDQKASVFFYSDLQYHHAAVLGKSSCRIEERVSGNDIRNHSDIKFKTAEAYAGFGLRFNPTNVISTQFSIGMGGYQTLNKNYEDMNLYRERSALVLQLKWSVSYHLTYSSKKNTDKTLY